MTRLAAAAAALLFTGTLFAAVAQPAAARTYDPNEPRIADPNRTCLAIPATARLAGGDGDFQLAKMRHFTETWDHARCMEALVKQTATVGRGVTPWEVCAGPGGVRLPYTFGTEGPHADVLPDLVARNLRQCGNALWAITVLVALLEDGGGEV